MKKNIRRKWGEDGNERENGGILRKSSRYYIYSIDFDI